MTHHVSPLWITFAVMLLKMVYCLPGIYDQNSTPSAVYGHSRQIPGYSQYAENTNQPIITPTNIYSNNPSTEQYQKVVKLDAASNPVQSVQTNQPNFHPSSYTDSTQRYAFKTPFDIFPSFGSPEKVSTQNKILNTGNSLPQSTFTKPHPTYSTLRSSQVHENTAQSEQNSVHELEKAKMSTNENCSITPQTIFNLLQHFQNILKQNHSDSKELTGMKNKRFSSLFTSTGSNEANPVKNIKGYPGFEPVEQSSQTQNSFKVESLTGLLPQSRGNLNNDFTTNIFTKTSTPPTVAYTSPNLGLNDSRDQWRTVSLGEQNIPETKPVSILLGDQSNCVSSTTEKTQSCSSVSSNEKQNGVRSFLTENALQNSQSGFFPISNVMFGVGNQQSSNKQDFVKSLTTVQEPCSTSRGDTNSSMEKKIQSYNILLNAKRNGYNALHEQNQQTNFPTSTVGYNFASIPSNPNLYDKYLAEHSLPDKRNYLPTPLSNLGYNYPSLPNAANEQMNNLNVPITEQNTQDRQQRLFTQNLTNKLRQNYANIPSGLTKTNQNNQQYLPTANQNNLQTPQVNYPTNLLSKTNYNFLRPPNNTPQDVQNYLSPPNQSNLGYNFTSVPK